MSDSSKKTALVLLNMGGPDSIEAIEPFLYNLFSDRDLIQLPMGALLQKPFAKIIAHFRSKRVADNYRYIGGKSPLLEWTRKQAVGIASELGQGITPYVAMRYWHPFADDVVQQLIADGAEQVVALSMYPHYTGATTGSSVKDFQRAMRQQVPAIPVTLIEEWYNWPAYIDALATKVQEGLQQIPEDLRSQASILFSAHALPQKFIDRGDPYLDQVSTTATEVMDRLGDLDWHLAFQSRSGPVKWMEPGTDDMLKQLAADGRKALVIVPISFVSDHIETLHEIDVEYREEAEALGIETFVCAPSLNDDPLFIKAMAALVRRHLAE